MNGNSHGQPNRTHAGRWLTALAMGLLPLTLHAQNSNQATRLSVNNIFSSTPGLTHIPVQGGGSVSLAQVSGGNVAARIPLTVSSGTGPIVAGVLRANPGATLGTVELTGGVKLPAGNAAVDAVAKIPVDKAQLGVALRNFAKRALPILSTGLAIKGLLDDLKLIPPDATDPNGTWKQDIVSQGLPTEGTVYRYNVSSLNYHAFEPTMQGACTTASGLFLQGVTYSSGYAVSLVSKQAGNGPGDNRCFISYVFNNGPYAGQIAHTALTLVTGTAQIPGGGTERRIDLTDQQVDDVIKDAPIPKWAPAFEEAVRNGAEPEAKSQPQLSGPSSVTNPGPTTTTTGPNGQPTTIQQNAVKTNIAYNGNQYTFNTTNTTTTTNNTTNETTTTTTENAEQDDLCQKNPDILACQKPELDTPEQDIPRKNFAVTFAAETLFGTGSCPANRTMTLRGQTLTVWDFSKTCDYLTLYLKPVIILLATFAAFMIISPGKDA